MTLEQIQRAAHAAPFRPFRLLIPGGRALDVPTADHISHAPSGRTVAVWHDDGSASIVDLLLISEIHFAPEATNTETKQ